ncbi:beta-ketoacyl synthase N-terminal-like domain-containing protein [Kutzneria sp. CA-103260]|uniref:beta-ketoacyl synthase N-terminal-like domain-containing protein n=1 Tax=Kutzneria sp. CA-103260 TaxID=2802641 RepID=UPI001BAC818A|nr:beta-ketoacyl synthase N-terminal-like domain-containing protein [Kutzneria sp. CA-103260]QUQ63088.1 3-oxoacyl-ACP synthase [Kutzneria sp. CA-103260]
MTTAVATASLAVTGCGVVSSAGLGLDALGDRLLDGKPGHTVPTADIVAEFPPRPLRVVSDEEVLGELGRRGLRYVDRLTTLGMVASGMALSGLDEGDPSDTGVVLGTATGSIRSITEVARDTLVQDKPYLIHPGRFPNTVLNSAAGQIAIRNKLRGVNATVASGKLSTLSAVRYADTAIRLGRVSRLVVGGVEELSPPMAWAWHLAGELGEQTAVGEGCAMFVLEDAARTSNRVLAEILACEVGFHGRGLADGLAVSVSRALDKAGVDAADVATVSVSAPAADSALSRAEQRGVEAALGRTPATVNVVDVVGECYSASGALQLAGLLALWRRWTPGDGAVGLVTSVGRDGNVGCLVVRDRRG